MRGPRVGGSDAGGEPRVELDLSARERRWYDRLRARAVKPRPGAPSGPRDALLLLPDAAVLLARLVKDPQVSLVDKLVAGAALAYVLSPVDLLPEALLGPLGLADDVAVVGIALSRLLNRVHPDLLRYHWSGQEDVVEAIRRLGAWTESRLGRLLFRRADLRRRSR